MNILSITVTKRLLRVIYICSTCIDTDKFLLSKVNNFSIAKIIGLDEENQIYQEKKLCAGNVQRHTDILNFFKRTKQYFPTKLFEF